ncbi:hypothetical protein DB345_16515 [Spartobacteria bacterium LR76]|nr:hypothetical protein DB345_16515 [Spartobacteria bacterium LR76]
MFPPLPPQKQSGFTLVELLISVSIAGTLAALLFATLPRIQQRAAEAKCIGNLHTIANASAIYVGEYGFWPSFNREDVNNPSAYGAHPWFYSLLTQKYLPYRTMDRDGYPCMVADALICPANKTNPGSRYQWTSAPYPWRSNYTTTTYWGNTGGKPDVIPGAGDRIRPSVISNSSAIYLIDSTTSTQAGYPNQAAAWNSKNSFIAKVHNGGANALLANGAVVRITPASHPDIASPKYWDPRYSQ